jgi:AraC-like DNA-binding protein
MSMNRHPLEGPTRAELSHHERIDWHDHAEQQLAYPSSGMLIVSTATGSWVVPPQRAVWLPATVAHSHQAYGATQLRTVSFPVDVNPLGLIQPAVLSVSRLLRELIIAITDDPDGPAEEQQDMKRVVLRQLRLAPALQFHLPRPADQRLREVAALMAREPGRDRSLADLGRAVGAGERTLSRLFRAETGMTFPQWRAQLRLHHSLTLLANGLPVTTTAITCGYSTPSAFTAAFRATFGTTPAAYRKDLADGPATPRLSFLSAVGARRRADALLELAGQVGLVGEAALPGDLRQRGAAALEHGPGPLDPGLQDELVGRDAGGRPEPAGEVEPAQADLGGQVVERDGLAQMVPHVVTDRPVLAEA